MWLFIQIAIVFTIGAILADAGVFEVLFGASARKSPPSPPTPTRPSTPSQEKRRGTGSRANEGKLLAGGIAGQVYEGTLDGKPIVIKRFNSLQDADREERVLPEVGSHPNIVRLYGRDQRDLYLERLDRTVLDASVTDYGSLIRILIDSARGVEKLHGHDIVHSDLKPPNILLSHGGRRAVLIDFSASVSDGSRRLGMTPGFTEQAAVREGRARKKHDIYSLAATWAHFWKPMNVPPNCELNRLAVAMLAPQNRPDIHEVLATLDQIRDSGGSCPHGWWPPDVPCPDCY